MKQLKIVKALSLLLVLSLFLAACGGTSSPEDTKAPATNAKESSVTESAEDVTETKEDVTIRIMSWHGEQSESLFYDGFAAVAEDYMAANPHVTIEFVFQPLDGYQQLLDTQFIANSAPELIHMQPRMNMSYANKGVLYNLSNDLATKSAYSDEATWFDSFEGGSASFAGARAGNQYGGIFFIPNDENPAFSVGQPFAYNKTIFKDLGLDPEAPPETWSEFMEICQTIKEGGKIPIAADNSRWVGWSLGDIGGQFGEKIVDQFFDEQYNDDPDGVFYTDKIQISLANGNLKNLDYYDDVLRIWKDYEQYWQEGWTGTAYEEATNLFFLEEAAMQKIGNWDHSHYTDTIGDTFDWGIFPVPYIDESISPLGTGQYRAPKGQQNYGFAPNGNIEDDPIMKEAVLDYLQYFSSVEAQNKYVNIAKSYSPVKGVEVPEEIQGYVNPVDRSTASQVLGAAWVEYGDSSIWSGYAQDYLTGRIDAAEFNSKVSDLSERSGKEYCDGLLQADGYEQQITDAKELLDTLTADNAAPEAITAQEDTVASIEARQEMMLTYYQQ